MNQKIKQNNNMTILIADDDDGHAELILEGLRNSGISNSIERFCDGERLLDFLEKEKAKLIYKEALRNFLLLLDINMPRLDGVETLKKLKIDPQLKEIPVIMLTTTDDPREIERCYQFGCSLYITKPVIFSDFVDTLHRLGLFLQIVRA